MLSGLGPGWFLVEGGGKASLEMGEVVAWALAYCEAPGGVTEAAKLAAWLVGESVMVLRGKADQCERDVERSR